MFLSCAILIALAMAWAGANVLIALVDQNLPPFTSAAAITAAGALFLTLGVRLGMRRRLLPTLLARPSVVLTMAATAIAVPQLCIVAAEDSISPGLTAVTGTLVPLLTYVVSSFVLRTTPWRLSGVAGVLIAIAGMIVFVDARTLIDNSSELFGVAIMACGSLVFVANGLYAAHQSDDLDQYVLTVWVVIFAAVGLSIAAMAIEGLPPAMPGDAELLAVAASGTVGIGLAYLFYYLLIARAGASFTALYAFLVPPFGVLFTVLFDDGTLSLRHVVGLAIVLCGLWFVMRPGTAAT